MIKNWSLLLVFLVTFNLRSQNFVATYSLAGVTPSSGIADPSPPPVVKGLLFSPLQAIGLSANSSASGRFSFSGWPLGGIDGSDTYSLFVGALSGTAYYECRLKVAPGSTLTLQSIEFSMRRSGTGVRNFSVRCDRDNFSSDLAASTGTNTKLSVLPVNVFFWKYDSVSTSSDQKGITVSPGNLGKNIHDSITIRIYAWNAEQNGGSFSVDNLSLSGHVVDSALLAGNREIREASIFSWYPNPCVAGRVFFSVPVKTIHVFNASGGLVFKEEEPTKVLDVSHLENGVYFMRIGTRMEKLVVYRTR